MSAVPFVTIAMPCLNEEGYIEACLESVAAQDYPRDRMEILVADGGSTDRTREILGRLSAEDPRIRMIDNPDRIQAAGMNQIIRQARGDVVIRMDVHCEYAGDYVRRCIEVLERTGADNVGGAQRPRAKTWFQKALCAALTSPLGVGGASYRSAENEGFVDTVFLGAFRRRVFETAGMYDPKAVTNEDAELNQRIHEAGGKVFLSRDIVVHYYPRASYAALAKQYYKYGQGRARTLLKRGTFPSPRPAIPFLMVVSGATLLATSRWHPLTLPAFGLYAVATGIEAIRVGRREGAPAIPIVWGIFPVLHASHGVGFASGLLRYGLDPDWAPEPERLDPIPVAVGTGEPLEA
ncbi:glycosyltransferase family 2 protein [Chondromyces apiculatus]|uniref:Glycosyl transferase, family 2 n=1 Tax=Chondromyces apiculatus DSM 436 TaxID=1192034 RepID=A0A017TDZ1_9BACT|nr:glycosyltransferase family 2 protein [Chondromyces apiculatus]EYF07508.1 Glycosyl transferase, family 2 [Chondromyces apiculatus DSM 436]